MELSAFLHMLFEEGKIIVSRGLRVFDEDDCGEAIKLIRSRYIIDHANMPCKAPDFDEEAGLWAAGFLFRAVQFTLLRQFDPELIEKWLLPYETPSTAASVYSVDLLLRHLNAIINLASRLAPDDPLVAKLHETAANWPFSSVGLGIEPAVPLDVILSDSSLRYTYGDRIIQYRDTVRAKDVEQLLSEIMGVHNETFWPTL